MPETETLYDTIRQLIENGWTIEIKRNAFPVHNPGKCHVVAHKPRDVFPSCTFNHASNVADDDPFVALEKVVEDVVANIGIAAATEIHGTDGDEDELDDDDFDE